MLYKYLTLNERYLINTYKNIKTKKEIARIVGVHPSTLTRELQRASIKGNSKDYFPIGLNNRAKQLEIEKSKQENLKLTYKVIKLIKKYLKKEYSLEQIASILK